MSPFKLIKKGSERVFDKNINLQIKEVGVMNSEVLSKTPN